MSTQPETTPEGDDFSRQADDALHEACARTGLSLHGARLIRLFATAVYHLPAADAVARIARFTSPRSLTRLTTSLKVTRWLATLDFPTVEPLPLDQPIQARGCLVTFWHYLPQHGPPPTPADLGFLLARLHRLPPPPLPLPTYEPLRSVSHAIDQSRAITEEERAWLKDHCGRLDRAYQELDFALPSGMIHGDAYRGNLLRDGSRVVLADWDAVSNGPREMDLIPTLQARRFGLPEEQRKAFVSAYGHDITAWPGYRTVRDIRELSTITALLHNGHTDPNSLRELQHRMRSIRQQDDRTWTTF